MWCQRPDPMEVHGLRPLTRRDGLYWRRLGEALVVTVLWIALWLWLLSGLYDIGYWTLLALTWTGFLAVFPAVLVWRQAEDIRRWPRRTD